MNIEYPDLADFLAIAEAVTGIDTDVLVSCPAEAVGKSWCHAPVP